MSAPTLLPTARRFAAAADPDRGPNRLYTLVQAAAGLLVPLWMLWLVRPWALPEAEALRRPPLALRLVRGLLLILLAPLSVVGIPAFVVCLVAPPAVRRPTLLTLLAGLNLLALIGAAANAAVNGFPGAPEPPKLDPMTREVVGGMVFRAVLAVVQNLLLTYLLLDVLFYWSFPAVAGDLRTFDRCVKWRVGFGRGFWRLIGTLFVVGFSLLPLAALLVALPAVAPDEAVLSDTVRRRRTWLGRTARRAAAVLAGLVVLVALLAFAIEAVSRLPLPEGGQLGTLARKLLGSSAAETLEGIPGVGLAFAETEPKPESLPPGVTWTPAKDLMTKRDTLAAQVARPNQKPLDREEAQDKLAEVDKEIADRKPNSLYLRVMLDPALKPWFGEPVWKLLPTTLVEHWPFVFLIVYATDLLLLLLIGRVPLAYNLRYLWVRRRDTALTAVAFTVVVAIVVVLLAFVNGMNKLNDSTGVPGNVLVLADGATDELFSSLQYGDVSNVAEVVVTEDERNRPIAPQRVARGVVGPDGRVTQLPPDTPKGKEPPGAVRLASFECYLVMNQPVPTKPGEPSRRRFLQVRALKTPAVGGAVHGIELQPGGKWFADDGIHQDNPKLIPCVLGEGAAGTLGGDVGKPKLGPGDVFNLGDADWVVAGVMKSEGTTFGSEIWCAATNNPVLQAAGKGNKFTTLVLRMADNTTDASRAMAYHVQNRYNEAKLKAYSEPAYYAELTKTNELFLTCTLWLAGVMAIGGVFGVMNTMFASIAARIKEVGVMRILGFKRWQILISFMLESLAIAFVGGLLGCALGSLANGFEATSTLSGGQGGGKSVTLKFIADYQTLAAGMLFTLVMGRLGGLVPALSAMRMEILDSLR